jgi:hypothetical protein
MDDKILYEDIVLNLIVFQLMAIAYRVIQLVVAMATKDGIMG